MDHEESETESELRKKIAMQPVCQYFKFKKQDSQKVSACWKFGHLLFYLSIAVVSFASVYCFESLSEQLGAKCFLDAKLVTYQLESNFTTPNCTEIGENNQTHSLCRFYEVFPEIYTNKSDILWGDENACYVYLIIEILSGLAGIICFVFTWIINRGGEGENQDMIPNPYRSIIPFCGICILFVFLTLYSTVAVQQGASAFCAEFSNFTLSTKCTQDLDIIGEALTGSPKNYFSNYQGFSISTKMALIFWICQVGVYLLRIFLVADFSIKKFTVYGKLDKGSEARKGLKNLLSQNNVIVAKNNSKTGETATPV